MHAGAVMSEHQKDREALSRICHVIRAPAGLLTVSADILPNPSQYSVVWTTG
jgi:hypothetical protein